MAPSDADDPARTGEGQAARTEPVWVLESVALAVHDRQLAEHGGGTGVRDMGGFASAMTRARNRWEYGVDDLVVLAAAYAFGIARNHPFVDGNKRSAWVVANLFLFLNGAELVFDEPDAIRTVERLAAGDLDEDGMADWFRLHLG